jgi:hypothetical protein
MATMVVPCVFDAIFAEFDGIFSCGRKICESFKDLKEFHEFFVRLLTIFDGFEKFLQFFKRFFFL